METQKNIYLVDDHVLVRNGLKELIEKIGPYKITGEFDNGKHLTDAYPFSPAPDLIVLDIEMPDMNGKAVMQWFKEHEVKTPVLLLSLTENEGLIISLFRLGVRGYLHKNCSSLALRKALNDIFVTGYYHDEMMMKAMTGEESTEKRNKPNILDTLTGKELEFLKLACDEAEYTYDHIASLMEVHPRTVNKYRESIFEKFGVRSKTGIILFAVKNGLIKL